MAHGTCCLASCRRRARTRGLCATHYARWRNGVRGDELIAPLKPTRNYECAEPMCDRVDARLPGELCRWHAFWSLIEPNIDNGCWEWHGPQTTGYARTDLMVDDLGDRQGHRITYTLIVGPITDGLDMDHLCRNRRCVNPDHLEPVTPRINNLRAPNGVSALNAVKTHCDSGHPFDADNTYVTPNGKRSCRTCRAEASRRYERKRGKRRRRQEGTRVPTG